MFAVLHYMITYFRSSVALKIMP